MRNTFARIPAAVATWSFARRRATRYLAVLLAGGLVAVAVAIGLQVHDHRQVNIAEAQARERGTRLIADVLSYDFNTIEAHFSDVLPNLGGDLRGQFDSVGEEVIIPSAKERHVVTSATVVESSVVSASKDAVTLLFFVNQSTTSTDSAAPKLDGSRVRVGMTEQEGKWVMTEMTPV
ncbi:hypothetical protein R4282_17625 [Rhodococcus oxybenzonivorans]|uniref:hypothetical protein n=1 Tax=Rhodococcus oxybenzonivorans TaxID=1990687 RepID=UPI0029534B82|nr:hypothetical protein [Rhodococcus oxybenzonivorans]MDV7354817.1 hypothetical protein [Rhodococcus oxybenzonivorans]